MIRTTAPIITGLIILFISCSERGPAYRIEMYSSERTLERAREEFREDLVDNMIIQTILETEAMEHPDEWKSAFWAMELVQYRSEPVRSRMLQVAEELHTYPEDFQRAFLEAVYALYPESFREQLIVYLHFSENPKLFAMAGVYLLRPDFPEVKNILADGMQAQFPDWRENPILNRLDLDIRSVPVERPPIEDLLQYPYGNNKPVFFSFQRKDRRHPGLTVLRMADGKFLRDEQGNIISVPHLALSVSNLPGYLTNGNTPQGIYSMQGTDVSENVFIGPTPNIQLRLPWEAGVGEYFHGSQTAGSDTAWSIGLYERLLPESWHSWQPVYEAYYAGEAGRSEIIAHGTTIDPSFYAGLPCYPMTPSLGCLTALELWSPLTGICDYSDQVRLLNACRQAGETEGFFIVVEIDDKTGPVTAGEILPGLLAAERP